jgi:hypothetical protein
LAALRERLFPVRAGIGPVGTDQRHDRGAQQQLPGAEVQVDLAVVDPGLLGYLAQAR